MSTQPKRPALFVSFDLIEKIEDFLDDYADVRDGSYGEQTPNRAMSLLNQLQREIGGRER